ncbi:TPA: ribonuclease HII [Patescibacteria group bacterium]|jgi:ribonuclease HII|nr:ribonuclease HII [Patescibacteria group bacterium]
MIDRFSKETELYNRGVKLVVGVDEVGRGPLAGPVVAAAVSFQKPSSEDWWDSIRDSKKLSVLQREKLSELIIQNGRTGIGIASVEEIEQLNILQASLVAMNRAVISWLGVEDVLQDSAVLVDGKFLIPNLLASKQESIVGGDGKVHTIAAASIVAKVARDNLMKQYAEQYPEYGFESHKGYGTLKHMDAIRAYGLTSIHRASFCGKIL